MESQTDVFESRLDLTELHQAVEAVRTELRKVIVGQARMVDLLLAALLADGHVLIEGVPGVAKTLTAKLLARTVSVGFSRIQFTPDLMPSDVLGTSVFNPKEVAFEFKPGPIFSNLILIDEVNRAPAKTQSALFEVMEERQVTTDGETRRLPPPFLVFATQNPLEHEGTYRLPEAQLDRFLFKIEVGYPTPEEEAAILAAHHAGRTSDLVEEVQPVLTATDVEAYQRQVRQIHVEAPLLTYIAQLVYGTRNNRSLYLGASPRASLAILQAAKAFAAMRGRDFVTPEDVQEAAYPALRHRILLTPEEEMEGRRPEQVIERIIGGVEVPR